MIFGTSWNFYIWPVIGVIMTIFLALWVCKSIQLNAVTIFFRKDDTSQQQAGNPPAYNLQHRMIHNPNKPTKMIKIVMLMLYLIIPTEARGSVSKKNKTD